MRAAVYYGKDDLRLEALADPIPGPGEVLIEVAANGICGTDLHLLGHGPSAVGVSPPFVLGHEFAGTVVASGDGVDLQPGTVVAVEPMRPCGKCSDCARGRTNICRSPQWYGLGGAAGGLAEKAVVTRAALHIVPGGLDPRWACLAEPLAVGMHAVNRSGLVAGQTAAVIGCGAIGIAIALCLRARGVSEVAVVESSPRRRATLDALGFDCILPSGSASLKALRDRSGGRGYDATFDAAGVGDAFDLAVDAAARGGTVVLVAVHSEDVRLDARKLLFTEKRVVASMAYAGTFPEVVDLLANGQIPLDDWVRIIGLSEIDKGLEQLFQREAIKLIVDPAM